MKWLCLMLLAGCSAPPTLPYREQLVVRGYLYAYQPVSDIELTSSVPLTSADTVGAPILDATATLTKRGVIYRLSASASAPGYYVYAGPDLTVAIGDTFDLTVIRGNQTVTARAIVPSPPPGLALSGTHLTIDTTNVPPPLANESIVLRWPNPTKDYFFTVVDAASASPIAIPRAACNSCVTTSTSVISAPTQGDSAIINVGSVHYFGRQRVRLYRVPSEYAALYNSRQQDSRDLNEPATNIRGGLGIFSAFAGDSAFFDVTGG